MAGSYRPTQDEVFQPDFFGQNCSRLIGTMNVGVGTFKERFWVPPATSSIQLMLDTVIVTSSPITVIGIPIGILLGSLGGSSGSSGGGLLGVLLVPGSVFSQIEVTVPTFIGGTVYIIASPLVISSAIAIRDPLTGGFITGYKDNAGNTALNVGFNLPWLVPNKAPAAVAQAGLGTTVIAAGVAGQIVYLFSGIMAITMAVAAGTAALQDTTGVLIARFDASVASNTPFDFKGSPLPAGRGVQLVVAGAAATAQVGLAFSQA